MSATEGETWTHSELLAAFDIVRFDHNDCYAVERSTGRQIRLLYSGGRYHFTEVVA